METYGNGIYSVVKEQTADDDRKHIEKGNKTAFFALLTTLVQQTIPLWVFHRWQHKSKAPGYILKIITFLLWWEISIRIEVIQFLEQWSWFNTILCLCCIIYCPSYVKIPGGNAYFPHIHKMVLSLTVIWPPLFLEIFLILRIINLMENTSIENKMWRDWKTTLCQILHNHSRKKREIVQIAVEQDRPIFHC